MCSCWTVPVHLYGECPRPPARCLVHSTASVRTDRMVTSRRTRGELTPALSAPEQHNTALHFDRSVVILLCRLDVGSSRHRALLFKASCSTLHVLSALSSPGPACLPAQPWSRHAVYASLLCTQLAYPP